jgi:hypothetical protein
VTSNAQPPHAETGDRILTSLAILKANWDETQRSYLDNFLPFIADCMNAFETDEVTAAQLSRQMVERFRIPLPDGVIQTLLRKAARQGLGTRAHGRFTIDRGAVARFDLTRQRSDAMRREEALIERLVRFALEHYELQLERNVAEVALLEHLERHSTTILRSALRGVAYQPALPSESLDYVVSSFVIHIFARDPEAFDYLEAVVKGQMLATAVYLPIPAEVTRRFEKVTLYFDTRLLLQALGYEGPEAERSMRQTLELSYELGASLAAFSDTVAETRGVLSGIANNLRRRPRFETRRLTAEWFRKQGYSPSDIELLVESLEADLQGLRITVSDRPTPDVSLTVDELGLEETLQETVHYSSRPALLHDLDALTAIHRLRGGRRPSQLERCKALFVTTNSPLAGVAREFFHEGELHAVPPALSDQDLTTLVWLKRPLDAPDLPRLRIVADCYAALEPGNELWAKYLDEIDKLKKRGTISEDDFFVLRYSFDAKQALMDRTFGAADDVSPELVQEVLERARHAIRGPEMQRAREAEASSTAAGKLAADAAERAAAAEQRATAAEEQVLAATQVLDSQRRRARNRAEARGRIVRRTVLIGLVLAAATVAYFSLPSSLELPPGEVGSPARWILRLVIGSTVVILLACQITGHSLASVARRVEVAVSRRSERRMLEQFGLTTDVVPDAAQFRDRP